MTGVYIHIPFCLRRCAYCDFITDARMSKIIPAYLDGLLKEIRFVGQNNIAEHSEIGSIYFGGGTPSLLRADQVKRVIDEIIARFAVEKSAEITLEANPATSVEINFAGLLKAGINRLSLGAQSFINSELTVLNRIHSVEQITQSVEQARQEGFSNISLDLIFGIPGQTLETWCESLSAALMLDVEHLSLYSLILEEGTPMAKAVTAGEVKLPDDDEVADMYALAREKLRSGGYEHYEISNWAKRPELESRHNKVYWLNEPYHGFGTGAHRRLDNYRSNNTLDTLDYLRRMNEGVLDKPEFISPATVECFQITPKVSMQETMMLGLRLVREGVSARRFRERYCVDIEEVFAKEVRHLLNRGLAEWQGRTLRLTSQGLSVGNQAFMEFV